jgi:hypothetical protein
MLVHCDVENHQAAIRELTKICIVNEYTMIVAWSWVLFYLYSVLLLRPESSATAEDPPSFLPRPRDHPSPS